MFSTNDELIFADEQEEKAISKGNWKILIVDDEEQIHSVTKLALRGFSYHNKELEFISAFSSKEAKEILQKESEIALILLDVVMESDDAGLELTKYIRKELKNIITRIILRTGQPGQAPEKQIILEYDINDYKNKAELTSQGLFTAVVSALRSYQDIYSLNASKIGLEQIIKATSSILNKRSFESFIDGVLLQIVAMMKDSKGALFCTAISSEIENIDHMIAISSVGEFENKKGLEFKEIISTENLNEIKNSIAVKKNPSILNRYVGYFKSINDRNNLIYIELDRELLDYEISILDLFMSNVSVALDNVELISEIKGNQVEILNIMGNLAENHSKETGFHIKRVTEYTYLLCKLFGLNDEECELVKEASAIHDIGKLVIPNEILTKPSKLTSQEYEEMKKHATVGGEVLANSKGKILKLAGIIAKEHHEKYNGTGYPLGIKGENIHLFGRIVAVADVFDALSHKRCYKEAWDKEKIVQFYKEERGEHFDPLLVDIFLENIDQFYTIKQKFED